MLNLKDISPKLRHTVIEGWLYFYTAFGVAAEAYLSTDDAYKYCNVYFLFWAKFFLSSTIAGFNALKAFRSMTFGRAYGTPDAPTNLSPTPPVNQQPTVSITPQTK